MLSFKKNFKFISKSLFFLLLLTLSLSACSKKDAEESAISGSNENVTLTFLTSPWPPDALNYLAQEKGFFKKNGVDVKLLWADGYEETFKQVESGELDVWNTTLLDAVAYHADQNVGQAILVEDYSAGADAIVTLNDQIKSVADLKGKNVGVEKGTVGEFFLNILLQREGLTLSDLSIIDTPSESIVSGLQKGSFEAGICYEPCPQDAVNAGGAIVVDSAKERNLIVDVYVAKADHVEAHREAYVKAIQSILEAGEYFNAHPDESAEIMSQVLNMPKEEVLESFKGLKIPTIRENQTAFNRSSGFSSLYNLAKLASQYLVDQGLISSDFDVSQVINASLVESINTN